MLDLETLATDADAVIVSLGAVFFDKENIGDKFYAILDLDDQIAKGRTKSEQTLDWWAKQSDAVRAVFDQPRTKTPEVLENFTKWLGEEKVCIWGNGSDFDNAVLGSCYENFGIKRPWSYSNNRCFRTLKNICAFPKGGIPPRGGTYHNALDDAVHQAVCAQLYLKAGLK